MELVLLLITFSMIPGMFPHSTCSINMCLRWTSKQGILKIICKVDDLNLPVFIINNFDKEIARCSIPFPSPHCVPTFNDTTVQQNINTNETIVVVRGRIDNSISGNWSCHHGYGRDNYKAGIEIYIPKLKEQTKSAGHDGFRCLKEIAFYTMTGVVISVVIFSIYLFLKCKYNSKEKRKQHFNRIASFSKGIDTCFESKICNKYSINNITKVLFITFLLLVIISGVLIGVVEKDSCFGSFVFIILGMILCLTLLILFLRISEENGSDMQNENPADNASSNSLVAGGAEQNTLEKDTVDG